MTFLISFCASIRPVPHFLQFHHFTPKISIFGLSISDTDEHSTWKYGWPQTPNLPRFQRITVFCSCIFWGVESGVANEIRNTAIMIQTVPMISQQSVNADIVVALH